MPNAPRSGALTSVPHEVGKIHWNRRRCANNAGIFGCLLSQQTWNNMLMPLESYPLVICHKKVLKMAHLWRIYLFKVVIFHSFLYVYQRFFFQGLDSCFFGSCIWISRKFYLHWHHHSTKLVLVDPLHCSAAVRSEGSVSRPFLLGLVHRIP